MFPAAGFLHDVAPQLPSCPADRAVQHGTPEHLREVRLNLLDVQGLLQGLDVLLGNCVRLALMFTIRHLRLGLSALPAWRCHDSSQALPTHCLLRPLLASPQAPCASFLSTCSSASYWGSSCSGSSRCIILATSSSFKFTCSITSRVHLPTTSGNPLTVLALLSAGTLMEHLQSSCATQHAMMPTPLASKRSMATHAWRSFMLAPSRFNRILWPRCLNSRSQPSARFQSRRSPALHEPACSSRLALGQTGPRSNFAGGAIEHLRRSLLLARLEALRAEHLAHRVHDRQALLLSPLATQVGGQGLPLQVADEVTLVICAGAVLLGTAPQLQDLQGQCSFPLLVTQPSPWFLNHRLRYHERMRSCGANS
mmetsp:Transcript_76725/g.215734  ORF Transcript_76725/g.215734 Transcript_76725/m.215734 type:complete len:367 (-) Transcript_76725:1-1101(-)